MAPQQILALPTVPPRRTYFLHGTLCRGAAVTSVKVTESCYSLYIYTAREYKSKHIMLHTGQTIQGDKTPQT